MKGILNYSTQEMLNMDSKTLILVFDRWDIQKHGGTTLALGEPAPTSVPWLKPHLNCFCILQISHD